MASITLDRVWVHRLASLSDYVTLQVFGAAGTVEQRQGEVRRYAGGRDRAVRRAGRARPYTLTSTIDRVTLFQLEEWTGESVMIRDPGGRLTFGVYWQVAVEEIDGGAWVNATVQLDEITHSIEAN